MRAPKNPPKAPVAAVAAKRADRSSRSQPPSGTELAYTTKEASAKAGQVSIEFENPQELQHDVSIEDSSGKVLGETELVAEGTRDDHGQPETGHLHVLLHASRATAKRAWKGR